MTEGRRRALTIAALAAGTLVVYAPALSRVPPYLSHDEIAFSFQAYTLAHTAHDANGRLLPLFFEITQQLWATPIVVYVTACFLRVLPLTETIVRLPSVLIGTLDVVLVYLVARRVFARDATAVLAAIVLALTPAHFIHSRLAIDLIYPLPFLLASLLCLFAYLDDGDRRKLFLATLAQGLGCYSYLGAAAAMPLYFLLTCATVFTVAPGRTRSLAVAAAGFGLPLLALVPWLLAHPEQFGAEVQMYNVYDASTLTPAQGIRSLLSFSSLMARIGVYYEFFNPAFLFRSGDSSLMNSTRAAGVFLAPLAVFLPVGLNRLVNGVGTVKHRLIAIGFALAPAGALLVLEVKVNRALILLQFAALIAAAGAEIMLGARRRLWRWLAIALLAAIPLQFAVFYRDYMTGYRDRSAFWFERNIRGALEQVIARDQAAPVAHVYISRTPRWINWYWRWYLAKAGRTDLLDRSSYVLPAELPEALPARSVVFGEAEEIEAAPAFKAGARHISHIAEPDGRVSFIVFER